jgi:pimeloyl-ACP methyl ester carboxylesterase
MPASLGSRDLLATDDVRRSGGRFELVEAHQRAGDQREGEEPPGSPHPSAPAGVANSQATTATARCASGGADPRPQLAHLATPALVLKGSCDYLSWASGLAYRQALPNARLVYLHHAGHNAYQDQPAAYLAVVRAFLTGQPLPIAPWTGSGAPADYQGAR